MVTTRESFMIQQRLETVAIRMQAMANVGFNRVGLNYFQSEIQDCALSLSGLQENVPLSISWTQPILDLVHPNQIRPCSALEMKIASEQIIAAIRVAQYSLRIELTDA
jgi:hypothetical protein